MIIQIKSFFSAIAPQLLDALSSFQLCRDEYIANGSNSAAKSDPPAYRTLDYAGPHALQPQPPGYRLLIC